MFKGLNRRQFMQTSAALGAGLYVSGKAIGADVGKKDVLNIALLGAGAQGQALMGAINKLGSPDKSGVRIVAVCDIWKDWNLKRVARQLKRYERWGYKDNAYVDYKEMLDTETDLDAVIVATPDFWHSEHTVACLEKGLNVYCEKEMSNTLEGAKKMVEAQKASGKLLQIGHQRRSNPRYIHCYDKLIKEASLLGRMTTINGQWNRSKASCEDLGVPEKAQKIEESILNANGFKDMHQFLNWRWFKGLGGGPIVDLGSHQIDIYSWFLGVNPKSVIASGGVDYWKGHEWYDNVMAIFEYETKAGPVRAFYQTLTTNSANGYYESFMGDEGTLVISEASSRGSIYREGWVDEAKWDPWVAKGYIEKAKGVKVADDDKDKEAVLDVRESIPAAEYKLPVEFNDPYHQPHLVNFFDSIRGTDTLNCPAEIGYETAVTVLKVNEAVEKATRLEFSESDFHA